MGTAGRLPMILGVGLCAAALGVGCATDQTAPPSSRPVPAETTIQASPSRADTLREWKERAREHFIESAAALEQVSDSSAAEDESGMRSGCQRLHDTNSLGLQSDLPSPDPRLTAELQRMIDDMNIATHACLRFALGRNPVDAMNYQKYLARAVEHLQRAKVILDAA
jgi:hypothetical protein